MFIYLLNKQLLKLQGHEYPLAQSEKEKNFIGNRAK